MTLFDFAVLIGLAIGLFIAAEVSFLLKEIWIESMKMRRLLELETKRSIEIEIQRQPLLLRVIRKIRRERGG